MRLGATTMSPYRINAIVEWQDESERRKERLKAASRLSGETVSAFEARVASMPQPRTWLEYATDPNGDGAPTSTDSEAWGKLDVDDPLNADSLLLDPSFAEHTPGVDADTLYFYQHHVAQQYPGAKGMPKRFLESMYPSIVTMTSASDYVPDPFNLFTRNDGTRVYAHDVDKGAGAWSAKRIGFNFLGGATNVTGLFVAAVAGIFLLGKVIDLTPKVVEAVDESVEEVMD